MTPEQMLTEYHEQAGIPRPAEPTVVGLAARCDYIAEELQEMRNAVEAGDTVAVADAIGDLLFLVYGSAHVGGYPAHAILAEVHRSNMTKTPSPGDGKAIKGPGYTPPNLKPILYPTTVAAESGGAS